ncbi:MAG: amino acid permease [Phycisphaerae bacterium]|nr:amino acid permease [Phycisphaerae bacterium]
MPEQKSIHAELSRDLNLFHVTMMGLGMMIGAGVFVGIGLCMGSVGPGGLLLCFALNGLVALFSAMSFAELASAIPRAGGAYNFARIGFGRSASFIAGWMEWLAAAAAGGFYAIVLSEYTLGFFDALGWMNWLPMSLDAAQRIFGVAAALLFLYVNYRGSSETGKVGALFTVGQMLFVVGIAVVGIVMFFVDPVRIQNFQPFLGEGSWWKLLGAMGVIYVAFEGFEVIAQTGDETINPKKTIPKAILYSVGIVTLTYMAVAFATVVAMRWDHPALENLPVWKWIGSRGDEGSMGFGSAIHHMIPGLGGLLVTLAVIFSATSALNATIYSATRTSYALGRDRMLPALFASISRRRRTPYVALLFTGVIVLTIALTLDPKQGAATASIMFLMLFFLVNLCVIRIRRNMGDELEYGYIMPLFPLFPVLAIILQAFLAGGIMLESFMAWVIAGGWVFTGVLVYRFYSRTRAITTADEIHVFHEDEHKPEGEILEAEDYRIMVAIANPDNALQLVQNTYKICQAKRASVELIHMAPVPSQVPLADAEQYTFAGKEAMLETMLYLAPQYPLRTTLRYCRNAARGIVSAVRERRANMLIMGWHGRRPRSGFLLGSTVDPIVETAPCDVIMLKDCGGNQSYKHILVPLAGGPNGALALEMAGILADPEEGEITAYTVASPRRPFDVEAFVAQHRQRIALPEERIHCEVGQGKDVIRAILHKSEQHDLLVLGGTGDSALRKMTHTPIPETIACRCNTPLVMCRAATGLRSWLKRYL